MKHYNQNLSWRRFALAGALAAFSCAPAFAAEADAVSPGAEQEAYLDQSFNVVGESEKTSLGLLENILPEGLDIELVLTTTVTYDDNIFLRENNEESDVIFEVSPGLKLGLGDTETQIENYLTADYRAGFQFFADNSDQDTVEHFANLESQIRFGKATIGLRASFEQLSGGEVEFGDRVERDVLRLRLTSVYEVSTKTSVELNGSFIDRDYKSDIDSRELSTDAWFDYQVLPKVNFAGGVTIGWLDVQSGVDQTFQQALLRGRYTFSDKLGFLAQGGVDFRQFDGSGIGDDVSPVWTFGAVWDPRATTSIELKAYRAIRNSADLEDQNIALTGVLLEATQDLLGKLTAKAGLGYEFSEYSETAKNIAANREDDYFYASLGVEYRMGQWATLNAAYVLRNNDSNVDSAEFVNNQFTVGAEFRF